MMRICWGGLFMCFFAFSVAGCSPDTECGDFPLGDEERQCVVNTIDEMVQESYPFAEYKGVDLNEFSVELHAVLEVESNDAEFLGNINQVVASLKDGHTRMERRLLEEPAVAPVDLRLTDEGAFIFNVDEKQWADFIGVEIVAVDGVEARKALSSTEAWTEGGPHGEVMLRGTTLALAGEAGTTVTLTTAGGAEVEMTRRSLFAEPTMRRYGDDIAYLRLDTFGFIDDLSRIDSALNEVMDTRGLIIDLRGNGGGFPSVTDGLFGRLISSDVEPFKLVDVTGDVARDLVAKPRGETYDGEVVVLVDGRSYSASNFFAHRMVYHQRGVLVGERTGGGAASPKRGRMLVPGVWFQVSSHMVRPPDGDHTESGIEPAIPVNPRQASTIEGEITHILSATGDPVMDRALRYLGGLQ